MNNLNISVKIMPQLKDNYSYLVISENTKEVVIIDPAESETLIACITKYQLLLKSILLTHHHNDHTAGVKKILEYSQVPVYSSTNKIDHTTNIIKNQDEIDLNFISFKVITTPGHTLDHVIFYSERHNILFSGDTLFRLGCGRIFEGTYNDLFLSIRKIEDLKNDTMVYCGHEYTLNNLKFLSTIFPNNLDLEIVKKNIHSQLSKDNCSIPFNLGQEKKINPFLSLKSTFYTKYKKDNNLNDFEMFSHLRKLKDSF